VGRDFEAFTSAPCPHPYTCRLDTAAIGQLVMFPCAILQTCFGLTNEPFFNLPPVPDRFEQCPIPGGAEIVPLHESLPTVFQRLGNQSSTRTWGQPRSGGCPFQLIRPSRGQRGEERKKR